ncbi:MAG: hypothetical protein U0169_18700 [Polyangiaceae bacterium]
MRALKKAKAATEDLASARTPRSLVGMPSTATAEVLESSPEAVTGPKSEIRIKAAKDESPEALAMSLADALEDILRFEATNEAS